MSNRSGTQDPALLQWLKKRSDVNAAIVVFSVVLIAVLWGTVILEDRSEYREAIAKAIKQNSNLAVAYEENVARTLEGLDAIALFIRHEYERGATRIEIGKYVSGGAVDAELFRSMSVVNEHGDIMAGGDPVLRVNQAQREHFTTHVRSDTDRLYISRPVVGSVAGTWQIPLSRRINKPDGTFSGIVVVSVDPSYFTRFYRKTDLGNHGIVALVGHDGIARARLIGNVPSFGDDMSDSSLIRERARNPVGSYFSEGGPDGVRRYISYRTLADYPLIVAVGTTEADVLGEYAQSRNLNYWTVLLFSGAIAVFAALLILATARQQRAAAALTEDIAERIRLEAELRELAATDMLTGLPNRRHFLVRLEAEHARIRRFGGLQAAVLMLDLDHFKRINDTHGHAAGDAVLRHLAALIHSEIRQVDTAGRLGGEEFAIILPGATSVAAREFAVRLRRKVAESPVTHDDRPLAVTVSIGVAALLASDERAEAALARADAGLYRAKEAGRNRVMIMPDDHRAAPPEAGRAGI